MIICMPKVNYVIAAWSGSRRDDYPLYEKNRLFYLLNHLKSLKTLNHNLDQITIVAPINNEDEPPYFAKFLARLPKRINDTAVVVIRRRNGGQSYGSYFYAYSIFGDEYDYYILVEDDYVFIEDYFDSTLIREFNKNPNCGFLCSYIDYLNKETKAWLHAAISNGITSGSTLKEIIEKNKSPRGLQADKDGDLLGEIFCQGEYDVIPQIRFSTNFEAIGKKLYDLTATYRAAYHAARIAKPNELLFFGDKNKKDLLIPTQWLKEFDIRPIHDIMELIC